MKRYHVLFAKALLLALILLVMSVFTPWALSQADTVTNIVGAALTAIIGYVIISVVVPGMFKSFFKAKESNTTKENTEEKA